MSLDKQRILNELGSVVDQLQSADCGCMGKLFTNPGAGSPCGGNYMGNYGGNKHGCCQGHGYGYNHGNLYNSPCGGESNTAMNTNFKAMGRCNPPKLYADTYNYLNQNLMQPIVKDVYNDLKNLTPANTIANNPKAGQMGLSSAITSNMPVEMSYSGKSNVANPMTNASMCANQMQNIPNTPGMMGNMAGVGPEIVNMMISDGKSKPANIEGQVSGGLLTGPMMIDAPNSPYGHVGVTPLNQTSGFNQAQFKPATDISYAAQGYSNLQSQNQTIQNQYGGDPRYVNSQNPMINNLAQSTPNTPQRDSTNSNPAAQQMSAAQRNPHGMHAQGVAKFNEMFPGVMQGLGGDLGFDPMAIAIQMNPANQQKVAMDTMQKMMNGTNVNKLIDTGANSAIQPVINGVKAASGSFVQPSSAQAQYAPVTNQQVVLSQAGQNQPTNYEMTPNYPQQQVYTALNANSNISPQELQQYSQISEQEVMPQTQRIIDPRNNIRNPDIPKSNQINDPRDPLVQTPQQNPPPQAMIKDPIFPVDTSKNTVSPSLIKTKYFEYNTLGQPVEMLPAKMFHSQEPNLPQTLSPQPLPSRKRDEPMKYSNVKSTVSKTSLIANKPIGNVPSRSQLQNIYNQYKGSQSFTQQNVRGYAQGATHSEGHIAANQGNLSLQRQAPVEMVGDAMVNSALRNVTPQKVEQIIEHIGDVPVGKLPSHSESEKAPMPNSKLRNGLQDIVYTSNPTSAAWSFHGNNHTPYYPGRRFRHRT